MIARKRNPRAPRDLNARGAAVLFALVILVTGGCEGPFGPPTLVDRLRLLDIRAEPPEIGLTDARADFASVIGNPQAESLECRWAVCLIQLGWAAAEIDCPGENSFFFGTDCERASLDLLELAEWLSSQGWELDPAQLPSDMEETDLPLFVGLEVVSGPKRLRGIKRLRLNLEGDEPNTNPVLLGLNGPDGLPVPSPLRVKVGERVLLKPVADADSRQWFEDEEGNRRQEDFLFSWFATAGSFRDRRTIMDEDSSGRRLEENEWYLDPAYSQPGPARLWLVLRDGRWGTSWLEFDCSIEDAP